jgi:hypothetical protein
LGWPIAAKNKAQDSLVYYTRQGQDRGSVNFGEEGRFDMEPSRLVGG